MQYHVGLIVVGYFTFWFHRVLCIKGQANANLLMILCQFEWRNQPVIQNMYIQVSMTSKYTIFKDI